MQKSKMAVWGGLTNSCEEKRGEKQRRKGKIKASSKRSFCLLLLIDDELRCKSVISEEKSIPGKYTRMTKTVR